MPKSINLTHDFFSTKGSQVEIVLLDISVPTAQQFLTKSLALQENFVWMELRTHSRAQKAHTSTAPVFKCQIDWMTLVEFTDFNWILWLKLNLVITSRSSMETYLGGYNQGPTTSSLRARLDLNLDPTWYWPKLTRPDLSPCRPRLTPTQPPVHNYL